MALGVHSKRSCALYHTSRSRSKNVVVEILGEDYDKVTVQDFYPSYDGAPGIKQKCWAHLLRDAKELSEKKEPILEASLFYRELKRIFTLAKKTAEDLRTAEERRSKYATYVKRLRRFAKRRWVHHDVKRPAKRLLKYSSELFTFILVSQA